MNIVDQLRRNGSISGKTVEELSSGGPSAACLLITSELEFFARKLFWRNVVAERFFRDGILSMSTNLSFGTTAFR